VSNATLQFCGFPAKNGIFANIIKTSPRGIYIDMGGLKSRSAPFFARYNELKKTGARSAAKTRQFFEDLLAGSLLFSTVLHLYALTSFKCSAENE
jgi:hypothetical protein